MIFQVNLLYVLYNLYFPSYNPHYYKDKDISDYCILLKLHSISLSTHLKNWNI